MAPHAHSGCKGGGKKGKGETAVLPTHPLSFTGMKKDTLLKIF